MSSDLLLKSIKMVFLIFKSEKSIRNIGLNIVTHSFVKMLMREINSLLLIIMFGKLIVINFCKSNFTVAL